MDGRKLSGVTARHGGYLTNPSTFSSGLQRRGSTGNVELSPDVIIDCSPSLSVAGRQCEGGDEGEDEEDAIVTLTQHVQLFSDALAGLKSAVCMPSNTGS